MQKRFRFFVTEALRSLKNNFSTTLAAVVTVLIVLYLFGVGAALGSYIFNYTEKVKNDVTIKVWLADEATDAQKSALNERLRTDRRLDATSLRFVSKAQALEEARKRFSKETLKLLVGNPFQARFEVKAKDPSKSAQAAASIAGMPGLLPPAKDLPNPDYGSETADKVLGTAKVIEGVLAAIALVLGIAAVLLIGNTIRLSIFSRRREVEVMKLVGATNWFVRWPFMLEGMICGLLGAIGAVGVLIGSFAVLKSAFENTTNTAAANSGVGSMPMWQLALLLLLAGIGLGAAGSGVTMRKFLRV